MNEIKCCQYSKNCNFSTGYIYIIICIAIYIACVAQLAKASDT